MARVLLLNGPNLNLLGSREPGHLRSRDARVHREARREAGPRGRPRAERVPEQRRSTSSSTASSGAAADGIGFLIFNPGAFTHTSIALRDASAVRLPFIEVHLSNTHAREPFRRHSYFSDIAVGVITGLGAFGYELAVRAAARHLASTS